MKKFLSILLIPLSLILLSVCGFFIYFSTVTAKVTLDESKLITPADKVEILDKNDELCQNASAQFPQNTFSLSELSPKVKFAFIDTEDKNFYRHNGFAYKRIVKAALVNVKARSFKQGASTISQQLIKNTHLSQEKTLRRKLQEMRLTARLEKRFSKDEILEKYLNTIYFGHHCFGLKSAAAFYFQKDVSALTLSDAAILAGLVKSPNNYSPFKQPENCKKRRGVVLLNMLKNGHLTREEKTAAENEPLPKQKDADNDDGSYFARVWNELEELADLYGFQPCGKIKIFTFLDKDVQKCLIEQKNACDCDKIYAVMDNENGGFNAFYSTVGAPKRPPGSTLKPIVAFAPAIEEGLLCPATAILDEQTSFGEYSPKNYGNRYYGYVSAREALEKSLNVPAVKILSWLGAKKGVAYAQKAGLPLQSGDASLALALGGIKDGVSLLHLISAYSIFPRGGESLSCGFIRKITLDDVCVYQKSAQTKRVFSEDTAFLSADMLRTTAKAGTAKKLSSLPFDVGAKTGTNGNKDGNTDAYTLSFTNNHTVGVWMGTRDNRPVSLTGGGACANVAYSVLKHLAKEQPPAPFKAPKSVITAEIDKIHYSTTHNILLSDQNAPKEYKQSELFTQKTLPKKRSEIFSKPYISTPSAFFKDGKYTILKNGLPEYYCYKIERYDYVTHKTLFDGKLTDNFVDSSVQEGKSYQYKITPYFQSFFGCCVKLPEFTTRQIGDGTLLPVVPDIPPDILQDDWWNK